MPTFDIVSEVDHQEVRNAVDQARREIDTRFDFKNTNSSIEQNDLVLTLADRERGSARCPAGRARGAPRQAGGLAEGCRVRHGRGGDPEYGPSGGDHQSRISSDKSREINRLIKEKSPKGVSSQTQGDSIRVSAKNATTSKP